MSGFNYKPLLLLIAGAVLGSLITFGLSKRQESAGEKAIQADTPPRTLRIPTTVESGKTDNSDHGPTEIADEEESVVPNSQAANTLKAFQQGVPMRPLPKPTMAFQANGLPIGVRSDAVNLEAYKRLPGLQPPLINTDGRDLGPEAVHMIESREEVPFPGGTPPPSASPMPFPQTVEEANRQAQGYASPLATP